MDQYYPDAHVVRKPHRYKDIGRKITTREFRKAREQARDAGLYRFDERWRNMDGRHPFL